MSVYLPLIARLIAVGLLFLVGLGGYRFGVDHTNSRWQAQANHAARVAQERFDAEQQRGQDAVASLTTERQAFAATYTHLQEQFHDLSARIPLIVSRARPVAAVRLGAGEPGPAGAVPGDRGAAGAAGGLGDHADRGVLSLSAGAVWMWNSALTGTDQPAGACGAADTSEAACAAATALTLDDAWRNHELNAQRCAEDRLNHQRLIDFINNTRPAGETNP